MSEQAIKDFFEERKQGWLKKNLSSTAQGLVVKEQEAACDLLFSPEQWLPNAAKRAGQISISTHPCTYSHPSSRKNKNGNASSIIANPAKRNDGFLRSGNVDVQADALGNAAALDVYKFLTLAVSDGQSLIAHLQQRSELSQTLLAIKSETYDELRNGFLAMMQSDDESITSSKIKQVYFPVDDGYHQLSILTASGIVFDLRKRLDHLRFGDDEIKEIKKKRRAKTYSAQGYSEIHGLTTIGYGGTKPQNISVLNTQNGGKAHLLDSQPPKLSKRDIQFPTKDFFTQSVNYFEHKDIFHHLHNLYRKDENTMHIRTAIDGFYQAIIDRTISHVWALRAVSAQQFNPANSQLSSAQKTWLLDELKQTRENENESDWLDKILRPMTQFIFHGYKKVLGKKSIMLGDAEYLRIEKLVMSNKEALR